MANQKKSKRKQQKIKPEKRILETVIDVGSERRMFQSRFDMSMLPEEQIPDVSDKIAKKAFEKGNYELFQNIGGCLDDAGYYDAFFEQAKLLFRNGKTEETMNFLARFFSKQRGAPGLPQDFATELADHLWEQYEADGYHLMDLKKVLESAKLTSRAEKLAHGFFKDGDLCMGNHFLEAAGKKLSNKECLQYANIAMQKGDMQEAFDLYVSYSLPIPNDIASTLLTSRGSPTGYMIEKLLEHVAKYGKHLSPEQIVGIGEKLFELGRHHYRSALKVYEMAGCVSSETYWQKGEIILKTGPEHDLWDAFEYLSKHDTERAGQKIIEATEATLEQDYKNLYDLCQRYGIAVPRNMALAAAEIAQTVAENRREYGELYVTAAGFYGMAGKPEKAKQMGLLVLQNVSKIGYYAASHAEKCFMAAGDEEGLAIAEFIKKNFK